MWTPVFYYDVLSKEATVIKGIDTTLFRHYQRYIHEENYPSESRASNAFINTKNTLKLYGHHPARRPSYLQYFICSIKWSDALISITRAKHWFHCFFSPMKQACLLTFWSHKTYLIACINGISAFSQFQLACSHIQM